MVHQIKYFTNRTIFALCICFIASLAIGIGVPITAESPPPYVTQWGSYGSGLYEVNQPWDIAVDTDNNVYVADTNNHRIKKYMPNGTFITQWGSQGSGPSEFLSPHGIAANWRGYVFVDDIANNRIQVFTSSGDYITQWTGSFFQPWDIAVDADDNVYVADTNNHRIQKYLSDGTFVTQWGSQGSGSSQFVAPHGIAVNSSGYVYVDDIGNNRIQVFTSSGDYITQWTGSFFQPWDIAVDADDNVYVADTNNHRIQKYSSDGTFVTQWGSRGSGPNEFFAPHGIAVHSNGDIYVADTGNSRIQKFDSSLKFNITPSKIRTNDIVTFNASESVDPTTDKIEWDFGDETPHSFGESVVEHKYNESGLYKVNLTVTYSAGQTMSSTDFIVVARIPVVLVHGWRSGQESWSDMETQLKGEKLEVWNFGYASTVDPTNAAKNLAPFIQEKRGDLSYNGQKYTGKIDIVCHSMGAIVSRYYMEQVDGGVYGKDVRQWIGIAPAHHGSGGADAQTVSWGAAVYKFFSSDTALPQLMTTSSSVQALTPGTLSPDTKYRVLAGYNPTHSMWFGKIGVLPALPTTIAKRTPGYGSVDGPPYYMTFSGDMIIAIAQAYDSRMGFDAFPEGGVLIPGQEAYEFDHMHITHSQEVIDRVSYYLNTPDAPLIQNLPKDEEISSLAIYAESFLIVLLCPVEVSITDPDGHTITKQTNEITGATYIESGKGDDGTPDATITIPERKVGDYLITVSPKSGAKPTDKFTLKLLTKDGKEQIIARNVTVNQISSDPFVVRVLSDGTLYVINPQDMGNPDTPVPEFPSPVLLGIGVIGLLGTVLYIQRTREN